MKISVVVKDKTLIFDKTLAKSDVNLNNTNVIDVKNMKFSDEFILENTKLIGFFLDTVCASKEINYAIIKSSEIACLVFQILFYTSLVKNISLEYNEAISYDLYKEIIKNNYLDNLECYDILPYLFESLNKKMNVITRNEILYSSKFMKNNMINTYSDIYYASSVLLNDEILNGINDELICFLEINSKLKKINVDVTSLENFGKVLDLIEKYQLYERNIKIDILENEDNHDLIVNNIDFFKRSLKKHYLKGRIVYSKEYRHDYVVSYLSFKAVKSCLVILITLFICFIISVIAGKKLVIQTLVLLASIILIFTVLYIRLRLISKRRFPQI